MFDIYLSRRFRMVFNCIYQIFYVIIRFCNTINRNSIFKKKLQQKNISIYLNFKFKSKKNKMVLYGGYGCGGLLGYGGLGLGYNGLGYGLGNLRELI